MFELPIQYSWILHFVLLFKINECCFKFAPLVKQYNELVAKLEKMSDGLKLHGVEPTFPVVLKEDDFRSERKDLEDKRQAYDQAISQARQAYEAYNAAYNDLKTRVANGSTMLYGLYGKKNSILADFGLAPYKTAGAKGPRKAKETFA
jgi:hypothetical protein